MNVGDIVKISEKYPCKEDHGVNVIITEKNDYGAFPYAGTIITGKHRGKIWLFYEDELI